MNLYIDKHKGEYQSQIEHYKEELKHIRTGQANPELVEGIMVNAYDSHTPIKQLATITVPEPKTIVIQPWDKSILKDIEKAIVTSNLGFTPANDGEVVRVPMPPLTEENRKELVKLIHDRAEKARVALRQTRDKVKEEIITAEKDKDISEDEKFRFLKELDKYTSDRVDEVNEITKHKEEQLMTV